MHIGGLELFEQQSGSGSLLGIPTDHGLPIGQGPNTPIFWTAAPTAGQILIGTSSTSNPILNTITAGSGVSIVNGPGTITISASTSGVVWSVISGNTLLIANHGYICIGGGTLLLTLPAAPTLGDTIEVILDGSSGWIIVFPGASVLFGNMQASTSLSSTNQGDALRFVCQNTNRWNITSSIGNIIIM